MDINLESYRRNQRYLAFVANNFLVSQLLRVLHAFDGDLLAAIVLGEIAHHNLNQLFRGRRVPSGRDIEQLLGDPRRRKHLLRPCNALSVSQATGIPRETVRRRIERLVAQGWIVRNAQGRLCAADALVDRFAHFHLETTRAVIDTAETLREGLAAAGPDVAQPARTGEEAG
jgi:hypothetical protein